MEWQQKLCGYLAEGKASAKALRQEPLCGFEQQQKGQHGWNGARGAMIGQAAGELGNG